MPILDQFNDNAPAGFQLRPAPAILVPLSIAASVVLVVSFFLPWYGDSTQHNFLISFLMDALQNGGLIGFAIVLFVALSPISALVLTINRFSNGMQNRKLDILCIAFSTYLPMLSATFYIFAVVFGSIFSEGGPHISPGLVIGLPACLFLLIDAGIQLNRAKPEVPHRKGLALWGILTGLLWLGVLAITGFFLISIERSVNHTELLAFFGLIPATILGCFALAAMLRLHRKRNLDGQLSLDRIVGISLIGGITAATVSVVFFFLVIILESGLKLPLGVLISWFITINLSYALSAFFVGSIVGAIMASPPRIDSLRTEKAQPQSGTSNFYEEL